MVDKKYDEYYKLYMDKIINEMRLDKYNYFNKIPKDISIIISIMVRPISSSISFYKSLYIQKMFAGSIIINDDDIIIKQDNVVTKIKSEDIESLNLDLINAKYNKNFNNYINTYIENVKNNDIKNNDIKNYEKLVFKKLKLTEHEATNMKLHVYKNIYAILLRDKTYELYIYDGENDKILSLLSFTSVCNVLVSKNYIFIINYQAILYCNANNLYITAYDFNGKYICKYLLFTGIIVDALVDHHNDQLIISMRRADNCVLFRLPIKNIISNKNTEIKEDAKIVYEQLVNIHMTLDPITNILYYIYMNNDNSGIVDEKRKIFFPLSDIYDKPIYKKGIPNFFITNSGLLLINYPQELRIYK